MVTENFKADVIKFDGYDSETVNRCEGEPISCVKHDRQTASIETNRLYSNWSFEDRKCENLTNGRLTNKSSEVRRKTEFRRDPQAA